MSSPVWVIGGDGCVWDRATLLEEAKRDAEETLYYERHTMTPELEEEVAADLADQLAELDELPEYLEDVTLTTTPDTSPYAATRDLFGGLWNGAHYSTDAGAWYVTDNEGTPVTSYGDELPDPVTFWRLAE